MGLSDTWKDKQDGVDDILAEDFNDVAHNVIDLQDNPARADTADVSFTGITTSNDLGATITDKILSTAVDGTTFTIAYNGEVEFDFLINTSGVSVLVDDVLLKTTTTREDVTYIGNVQSSIKLSSDTPFSCISKVFNGVTYKGGIIGAKDYESLIKIPMLEKQIVQLQKPAGTAFKSYSLEEKVTFSQGVNISENRIEADPTILSGGHASIALSGYWRFKARVQNVTIYIDGNALSSNGRLVEYEGYINEQIVISVPDGGVSTFTSGLEERIFEGGIVSAEDYEKFSTATAEVENIKIDVGDISEKLDEVETTNNSLRSDFDSVFEKKEVGKGKNLLDTSKSVIGFISNNGEIDETQTAYNTSDFISVSSGENIVFSALRIGASRENRTSACTYNAYSDENTVIDRKVMPQVSYYTVPENAIFIRVSYDVSLFEQQMLEKGTEMTDYEPFQGVIEELKIKEGIITVPKKVSELENDAGYITADEAITSDEMFDLVRGKNLLNLNDDNYIIGQAVSSVSGNPTEYADGAISGYIAVVSGENLVASARRIADGENGYRTNQTVNARWYGYDENKQYVSSAYMFGGKDYYTVPEGIAFIRVAHNTKMYTEWMVEVGAVNTAYEAYKEPVKVIKNDLYKSTPHNSKPLALPETIHAFANLPIMTYLRNIMVYDTNDVYVSMLTSSKGKLYKDRWEYTPSGAETFIAKYIIENHNGDVLNSKDVNIIVKSASTKDSLTALVIGDSTVEAGVETEKMSALATADNYPLTLLGTKGSEAKNNWHEGRGGWTAQDYCEKASKPNSNGQAVTNAFYNPETLTFDFSYYMTQQGYGGVDCVFIQLGINDLFGYKEDTELERGISTYLSSLEKIINSIHSYDSNIKVVLNMIIPCIDDQDKFTEIYGMSQTTWRCRKNTYEGNIALMNRFGNTDNVYISSYNSAIDTVNNIPSDVHPSVDGYNQLGTQMYSFMRAIN